MEHSILDLRRFGALRDDLIAILKQLQDLPAAAEVKFAWSGGQGPTVHEFCTSATEEALNKPFTVAVVGAFNTGKSSLLNVLLDQIEPRGRRTEGLLPEAAIATTAAVTVLHYAPEKACAVVRKDGSKVPVAWNDVPALLADQKVWKRICPHANQAHVRSLLKDLVEVRLGVPSPLLKAGVEIVDTPGLGAANRAHGELTRRYLAQCDAALFLISTDPTMGEREMTFLQYAAGVLDKFLFIQTKRDLGMRTEKGEVVWKRALKEHSDRISEVMGVPPERIYAVSALQAADGVRAGTRDLFDSGIPSLRDELSRFLGGHSGFDRLRSWLQRAEIAHERVAQHLASSRQRLEERLTEATRVLPTGEDFADWELLRNKLDDALDIVETYYIGPAGASPPALLHRLLPQQREFPNLADAGDEAQRQIMGELQHIVGDLASRDNVSDDAAARLERRIVKTVRDTTAECFRSAVHQAFEAATRAARSAIPVDRRPAVITYLTYDDVTITAEKLGLDLDRSTITEEYEVRIQKGGFWAALGRFLLSWLDKDIGTELVERSRLNTQAVTRAAESATRSACHTITHHAMDKLRRFHQLVLDEMDAASARARSEAEKVAMLRDRSREQCEAELVGIRDQQTVAESVKRQLVECRAALESSTQR